MFELGGFGIFLFVLFIIIFVFIIKCCIDSGRRPKVTRRAHDETYETLPSGVTTTYSSAMPPPRETIVTRIDSTEIDGIVVIPEANEDSGRPPKVTRRPHDGTYQNVPYDVSTTYSSSSMSPPREPILTRTDDSDIDRIVVVPNPNEASPVVVPPYPVEPRHPTPQAVPPGPGFATHNPPYPAHTPHPVPAPMYYPPAPPVGTAPYTPSTGPAPYPPVGVTPYPPTGPPMSSAPYPDYSAQPPSYSEAVSQPPLPTKEGYSKQAPYNPNY